MRLKSNLLADWFLRASELLRQTEPVGPPAGENVFLALDRYSGMIAEQEKQGKREGSIILDDAEWSQS